MGVGGPPYDAVVFDLDDTLIVEQATAERSLRAAARLLPDRESDLVSEVVLGHARRIWRGGPHHPLCLELGISSWEGLWSTFRGGHPRLAGLREWAATYAADVWQASLVDLGVRDPGIAERMDGVYRREQWDGHPAAAGADALLRELRRSARLGLLTNGLPDIQRRKLVHAGLADRFDAVVVSGEAGRGKPDPAIFECLRTALGVEAGALVMVGDSWASDVRGALDAGWSAVWMAHGRSRPEPDGATGAVPSVEAIDGLRSLLGLGGP